jgi:hypothetical protein
MQALVAKTAVVVIVLGLLRLVVAWGDRETFIPPPESVTEGFVRQLAAGRYDRALPFLSRQAGASTDATTLEVLAGELERSVGGAVEHIEAEPVEMTADLAETVARVRGRHHAQITITFALVCEQDHWKIDGWSR